MAVLEGSSLKRLLVEVCDLAFDSSSCRGMLMISENPLRKFGGCFNVTLAEEVGQVAETQTRYLTDK